MQLYAQNRPWLDTGLLVFARVLAFMHVAPVFGRKDIPGVMKTSMAVMMTLAILQINPQLPGQLEPITQNSPVYFTMQIFANVTVGLVLGLLANVAIQTVGAAGNLITNQAGLNSAALFDPGTRSQSMLLEPLFLMFATWIFMELGGMRTLVIGINVSLQKIPVMMLHNRMMETLDIERMLEIINSIIPVALVLTAPVFVVTLAVDVMLGILNRTAQQIPVFQISNTVKPTLALLFMLLSLPQLFEQIERILLNVFALQ